MLTCLVDLYYAAVGQLFQQPEKRSLEVSEPRVKVFRTDVVNTDRLSSYSRKHQPLSQILASLQSQHAKIKSAAVACTCRSRKRYWRETSLCSVS